MGKLEIKRLWSLWGWPELIWAVIGDSVYKEFETWNLAMDYAASLANGMTMGTVTLRTDPTMPNGLIEVICPNDWLHPAK